MERWTIFSLKTSKGLLCDFISLVKNEYCKLRHLPDEISGRCFCCLKLTLQERERGKMIDTDLKFFINDA